MMTNMLKKNHQLKSWSFLLIFLVCPLSVFSQIEQPCYPDCLNDPFGGVQYHTMTLPGGCEILVSYETRFACGRFYDVMIHRIVRTQPGDPACDYLDNMSIADVLALATEQFLIENPMGFPPNNPGECERNYRVIKGNCWSKLSIPFDPQNPSTHYYPCKEPEFCCLATYTVCLDECGNRTVTNGGSLPQGDCSNATKPFNGGPCEPVCF